MTPSILIVGAGLSGLSAAWHCHKLGLDFQLIEARDRLGGRALTQLCPSGAVDLGPSWVWRGQPYVASLLQHFSIPSYDQYCEGTLLHQTADGQIHRNAHLKPMQYAQRLEGGVGSLVSAMANDLPAVKIQLNTSLTEIASAGSKAEVKLRSAGKENSLQVDKIALAIPPRLIAQLSIKPALPAELHHYLQTTPTWMAAQAKFFAIYEQPFWRTAGFSGDAFSATGVLAEVHDASSPHLLEHQTDSNACYALFGFVRLNAEERREIGGDALQALAVQQLAEFFGAQAQKPLQTILQDWSTEAFTAAPSDSQAHLHHPSYSSAPQAGQTWDNSLDFISAETSSQSGGLIEGALQRGAEFAHKCFAQTKNS